jgi:hypothetical protein
MAQVRNPNGVAVKLLQTLSLLKRLEWSSYEEGPGNGFMDSGPGRWFRACPTCHQVCPDEPWEGSFNKSAVGHKKSCELKKLIG